MNFCSVCGKAITNPRFDKCLSCRLKEKQNKKSVSEYEGSGFSFGKIILSLILIVCAFLFSSYLFDFFFSFSIQNTPSMSNLLGTNFYFLKVCVSIAMATFAIKLFFLGDLNE